MSTLLKAWLFLVLYNLVIVASEIGTCNQTFRIFKHTVASSDSLRDCNNLYKIFPTIYPEDASKFHQGECAYQCKLELPDTCFKIHAPQTQYDEGLLHVDTMENIMNKKWEYSVNNNNKYDTFFDFNIGFWVKSLDDYITHWIKSNNYNLKYFGIEWFSDIQIDDNNYKNNKFYSILINLPSSSSNFEFISYIKPSIYLYNNLNWIQSDIPRCSFMGMNNPYPWNRNDNADIVPVKISHATTDINSIYNFYINIMEASLLGLVETETETETKQTQIMFILLIDAQIELQFIKRDQDQTFGDFTLNMHQDLLMETHRNIITSPFCGQDRWMDTHYAYGNYGIDGLMDRIFNNLNKYNIKYKVGRNSYKHASKHTKDMLSLTGFEGDWTFGLWIIEPTGQSIKTGGIITDPIIANYAPIGDPFWCPKECNFGLVQGEVDPSHVYIDDDEFEDQDKYNYIKQVFKVNKSNQQYFTYCVIIGIILLCGMSYHLYSKHYKKEFNNNDPEESTPLIQVIQ